MLHWNRLTFTDLFGVDFLAMVGRAVLSLRKTGRRYREEAPPGTRIWISDVGRKGVGR